MSNHDASTRYWGDWFWKRAGGKTDFPADIGYAAMCALEVYVEEVSDLTTVTAASRLKGVGIRVPDGVSERRIHGCLTVGRRGAVILVERNDDEAQKRFTIAHECAHFILEVRTNQERATCRLGQDFSGVLHGLREATPIERIDAQLHNVSSDALAHFIDRTATGGYGCGRIYEAECLADDLAVEILAPRAELIESLSSFGSMGFSESLTAARRIAERRFGLPEDDCRVARQPRRMAAERRPIHRRTLRILGGQPQNPAAPPHFPATMGIEPQMTIENNLAADPDEVFPREGETGADTFASLFGESLSSLLDPDSWTPGADLANTYARLEREVRLAVDRERRVSDTIRKKLFPRIEARALAGSESGVYVSDARPNKQRA